MMSFVVVACRPPGPAPEVRAVLDASSPSALTFPPARHRTWSNPQGTVWFAGWQDGDDDLAADGWHQASDGLTAVRGQTWPRTGGWVGTADRWVAQLHRYLATRTPREAAEDLAGVYVAASLSAGGPAAICTDPFGLGLLYTGSAGGMTVLGTRAGLVAEVLAATSGRPPPRDAEGVGWLAFSEYCLGSRTGFEGVELVPPGAVVEIDGAGSVRTRPSALHWDFDTEPSLTDQDLDEITEEMTTSLLMARRAAGSGVLRLGLTGGKDSRMILALLLANGMATEVQFDTHGAPDLPDVQVATAIAERFELHHVINPRKRQQARWRRQVENRARRNDASINSGREVRFRLTAHACGGGVNVADGLPTGPLSDPDVLLTGVCGEALRTNFHGTTRFKSKRAVARLPDHLKFGTAGILQQDVRHGFRERAHDLLFEGAVPNDSPQDIVDRFYLRHRMRRWFGAKQEVNPTRRMFPLYSLAAFRAVFTMGGENRHAERLYHRFLTRTCPSLLEFPFAGGDDLPPDAADPLVAPRMFDDPVPAAADTPPQRQARSRAIASRKRNFGRDVLAERLHEDVEIMHAHLGDPSNPAFAILDAAAVTRALDGFADLNERQRMQVYGAATAAIWLGGHELAPPPVAEANPLVSGRRSPSAE